jgi:hypothetical protein
MYNNALQISGVDSVGAIVGAFGAIVDNVLLTGFKSEKPILWTMWTTLNDTLDDRYFCNTI